MMVMTAKVDSKKVIMAIVAVAALVLALILLFGGSGSPSETTSAAVSGNDARVKFLSDFGWEVAASPVESGQVRIPKETTEVYERYNTLQKNQGYDLTAYAGKNVMRYVYKINNYPGATEPVYATLLVFKNTVIGGDVTDTAADGKVHGFKKPETGGLPTTVPETTENIPTESIGEPTVTGGTV